MAHVGALLAGAIGLQAGVVGFEFTAEIHPADNDRFLSLVGEPNKCAGGIMADVGLGQTLLQQAHFGDVQRGNADEPHFTQGRQAAEGFEVGHLAALQGHFPQLFQVR